ncbi:MAG: sugar phosphate isomerase/epimerase [Defluviitaleaceae bacterium]|nr:sugar phosphate isomerase/epimerase [Defluviitaleaceae bacterium]
MRKSNAAWIGFTPKDEFFWENLEELANLGFKAYEPGEAFFSKDSETETDENIKRLWDLNLKALTVSVNRDDLSDEALSDVINKAHKINVDRATIWCGWVNSRMWDQIPQYDDYMKELERYETAGSKLNKEGIKLTYHNHSQEYTEVFKGVQAYNYMLSNTENVHFLLDVCWAHIGGANPVEVMRRIGDRLTCIHLKDYVPGYPMADIDPGRPRPTFTAVGTGVVDIKGVMKCAMEMELPYISIEQDQMRNLDCMSALNLSYLYLKEIDCVN